MLVHFYIVPESFESNNLSELISSLEAFLDDYGNMLEYQKDNRIIAIENIYSAVLATSEQTLGNYIYEIPNDVKGKEREIRRTIGNILRKLPHVCKRIDEIIDEIENNNEDKCTGIISITPLENIAKQNQIVYDKTTWFDFRRFHLGIYPGTADNFINECKKYYIDFFFHNDNYNSIKPILKDFSEKIIYHLSALHDIYPTVKAENPNENLDALLKIFSTKAKLDQDASLQGKSKFNGNFEFDFITKEGVIKKIICEPHLKLCKNNGEDGHFYDHRIYFHFGKPDVHNGKVLIAHIGYHR